MRFLKYVWACAGYCPEIMKYRTRKEPLNIGHFCRKWPMKIRDPMSLRHPVSYLTWGSWNMCEHAQVTLLKLWNTEHIIDIEFVVRRFWDRSHRARTTVYVHMGWLRLVVSSKLYLSLENIGLFCRALLQKRPIILRSLLIVATPYTYTSGN